MEKAIRPTNTHEKTRRLERILGVSAIVTIVAAWLIGGAIQDSSFEDYLAAALPRAASFNRLDSGIYAGLAEDGHTIVGFVASGTSTGYGGPMEIAVGVDPDGNILGFVVIENKETPFYLANVLSSSFGKNLLGKSYADSFEFGTDIDGVTGATYTSAAIADALKLASRKVATGQLGRMIADEPNPKIIFGIPESMLLVLFAAGYIGRQRIIKQTKIIRWATMLTGMIVIGFIYNSALSISKINMFLAGYWPEWQTNLYWYILVGGIIFVFTADNRNPYCEWFCPFGAAQECMGAIGGAKSRFSRQQQSLIDWVQRGLAWGAIVIALLLRNPGVTSYELFGSLFKFSGTTLSFVLLGIVLITSLVVHRFWCRTLCPIRPVEGFIRMVRGWVLELWQQSKRAAS
jgi:hypothetical protein